MFRFRGSNISFWLAGTALLLVACADEPARVVGPPDSQPRLDLAFSLDRDWASLAASEIPGFAGHYLDNEGRSVVLLTDQSSQPQATAYVRLVRERLRIPVDDPIIFKQARFGFDELKQQHDRLAAALADGGFVLLDIDEVTNSLFVGVESDTRIANVRALAGQLGLPSDMLVVEQVPRAELRTNLQDAYRPAMGGLQINRPSFLSECTLGFNVYYGGEEYFTTASHCSDSHYSPADGSVYRQPDGGKRIGTETIDVSMWTGTRLGQTCHRSVGCRLTDVNLSLYDDTIDDPTVGHGRVARPTSPGYGNPGSSMIQSSDPFWRIEEIQPMAFMLVGQWVNKVGRTTGWTRGQITRTCFTVPLSQGDLLCQFEARVHSQGGDSGSPIFMENNAMISTNRSWVTLFGILFGGPFQDYDTTWFGTVAGVSADLGLSGAKFCVFDTPFNYPYGC